VGHLDPFVRGEDPACNATIPQIYQVGDLSGKYGKITSDAFEATLPDDFGSLNIVSNASIWGKKEKIKNKTPTSAHFLRQVCRVESWKRHDKHDHFDHSELFWLWIWRCFAYNHHDRYRYLWLSAALREVDAAARVASNVLASASPQIMGGL
jgi:hypothetical protein